MEGWCPVMNDSDLPTPSQDTLNFTILIKNFIENKYFGLVKSNLHESSPYLRSCIYDPVHHRTCPIFRIGTLLNIVEFDPVEQGLMLTYGGIININIDWICNLDRSLNHCLPDYSFSRLDRSFKEHGFEPGFAFR